MSLYLAKHIDWAALFAEWREFVLAEGVRRRTNVSIVQQPFDETYSLRWTAYFNDEPIPGAEFYKTSGVPVELGT